MSAQVTIVVVPRERFSYTDASLESIYEHTRAPFDLVYVDGGSPARIERYLRRQAREKGFRLIRTDRYLSPNEARNVGLRQIHTKYVVFIDNDAVVTPGWLEALLQCAEETGAWLVGPLYLIGKPEKRIIHMAGGAAHITEEQGKRILHNELRFDGKRLVKVQPFLQRGPSEHLEFHCLMARTEVFERIGLLDERLLSADEHLDLCLTVRRAGGTIYLEPSSLVSYIPPPPFHWSDFPYFWLRWSEEWNSSSVRYFFEKWNLETDSWRHSHEAWLRTHRRLLLRPLLLWIDRVFGRHSSRVKRRVLFPLERMANRWMVRFIWARPVEEQGYTSLDRRRRSWS